MGDFRLQAGYFRLLGAAVEDADGAFHFLVGGFATVGDPSLSVDLIPPFFAPYPLS